MDRITNIKEQKSLFEKDFVAYKDLKLKQANTVLPKLNHYNQLLLKRADKVLSGTELFTLIDLDRKIKYIDLYEGKDREYFLDINKLENEFNTIQKDERVLFLYKHAVLAIIDMYFDLKISSDYLNTFYGYTKNKRKKTLPYFVLKEAIEQNEKINITDRVELLKYNSLYDPIRNSFIKMIKSIQSFSQNELSETIIQSLFFSFVSGDIRKIEKQIFPTFYDFLILHSNIPTGMRNTGKVIKRDLLFNIFKIIQPTTKFFTKEEVDLKNSGRGRFYDGNFYEYKTHKVKSIIGK